MHHRPPPTTTTLVYKQTNTPFYVFPEQKQLFVLNQTRKSG